MILLTTTLIHTFIAGFVWQSICLPFTCWSVYFMCVVYQVGINQYFPFIYLLGLLGSGFGALMGRCSSTVVFVRRCNLGHKTNILFYVKLFVLFVIYNVYEYYGPSLWTLPMLAVSIVVVCVIFWLLARGLCVLKINNKGSGLYGFCQNYTYKEKTFGRYATWPMVWLLVAVVLVCLVNSSVLLVLFNVPFITPFRVQCVAAIVLFLVVLACLIIFNCSNWGGKKYKSKPKYDDCEEREYHN